MYRTGVSKQKKAVLTARRYRGACLNVSKHGPDTTTLAITLWSSVAIPAILFGCDCIPFSECNIVEINRIQSQLCKSLLSLPNPVNNFVAQTELAMQQFKQKLWTLQLNSCLRWMELPSSRWANLAILEHLSLSWKSPYWDYIAKIKNVVGMPYLYSKEMIAMHLDRHFIKLLNKDINKANLTAVRPVVALEQANYICENSLVGIFSGVKFNYCKDIQCQGLDRKRVCPKCPGTPYPILSSEYHVSWICPIVSSIRKKIGISNYINMWSVKNFKPEDSFYFYMKGLDHNSCYVTQEQCMERATCLKMIRDEWIKICLK